MTRLAILPAIGLLLTASIPATTSSADQPPPPNWVKLSSPSAPAPADAPRRAPGDYAEASAPVKLPPTTNTAAIGPRSSDISDRDRETSARADLIEGEKASSRADSARSNAARLNALDDAISHLKRARGAAYRCYTLAGVEMRGSIDDRLVGALDDQADIYVVRHSLPIAKKRVTFALQVKPLDERSQRLLRAIENGEAYGVRYQNYQNGQNAGASAGSAMPGYRR